MNQQSVTQGADPFSNFKLPAETHRNEVNQVSSDYTHYLDPGLSVEQRFQIAMDDLEINPEQQEAIRAMLGPLKTKHFPTYEHTLRVGLLARNIASVLQLDEKALFYAGTLHDIGKAQAPLEVLAKTSGWTEKDSTIMSKHVMDGYRLLRDQFDFTAQIVVWHHRFQPNAYPKQLPKDLHEFSEGSKSKIKQFGRIVAIADTFDALHRINDHHGTKAAQTGEEIKDKMLQFNPDLQDLVERLFRLHVLTTFIVGEEHAETTQLDQNDSLYLSSFTHTAVVRDSRNTRRHIELATAIEALSNKPGCTTRYYDTSRHLQLEYFVTAGINIADAFQDLAQHVENTRSMVGIYQYGSRAQLESKRNRRGGRINQGIIELLVPIVATQHLVDSSYALGAQEVLERAHHLLSETDRSDVEQLIKLKQTAHQLSHMDREVPTHNDAKTVNEYYQFELDRNSESATSKAHNAEFLNGFPTVLEMVRTLENCPYPHFSQRVEEAFVKARAVQGREVASGFLADCIAVAIYMTLSQNPQARVFG